MYNLANLLTRSARRCPDRPAIRLGDACWTYAELDALTNQVANVLVARGIERGDKVALTCPNIPSFTAIYFAILKAGAVVVPLNVLLKRREVAYHLSDSDAKAYFCFEGTPELPMGEEGHAAFTEVDSCRHFFLITADPAAPSPIGGVETLGQVTKGRGVDFDTVQTDEEDTAVILYTSGTTGQSKGAELRHRNMRDNVLIGEKVYDVDPERPDRYLCALPLFHSFGQTVIQNSAVCYGATVVMQPRFDPTIALRLLVKEKITIFAGVPTMYWGLLRAIAANPDHVDLPALSRHLRIALAGGAALPAEVHKEFETKAGVAILEGYGLSETSPVASFSEIGQPVRVGSIGTPVPGVSLKLLQPNSWAEVADHPDTIGEIAIKGHNVMKGYYKRPDATAEVLNDGWFRTGDLAKRDSDGWYYIVDRSKDMIIRGGYNVYPREIEELLLTHPDVSLAAVIGVPDEQHGEEIKAFVIRRDGSSITPGDLVAWSKGQLAAYKYPRQVEFVPSLPMTSTGKILKRDLR